MTESDKSELDTILKERFDSYNNFKQAVESFIDKLIYRNKYEGSRNPFQGIRRL